MKNLLNKNPGNGNDPNSERENDPRLSSQLMQIFESELKDIYWAEKALVKAIPNMIKNATSTDLVEALTSHLEETKEQIIRLEIVFKVIDRKAVAEKCDAMAGLIEEAGEIMENNWRQNRGKEIYR
jgi:ferritin-like metal-binding protein YciE